jgi:membrane protein DedA with SNARE-associated domain
MHNNMADWIIHTIESTGYLGIVFLMFVENIFPPIPSELIMPLAGFAVSRGNQTFFGVVIAGTVGSMLGALPLYYAGYFIGERRLHGFVDNHGRWLTVSREDLEKAERWFDTHGRKAVLLCRLVPGIRSLISIPAGLRQMPLPQFLCYTALGAGFWTFILTYAGYVLGEQFQQVEKYLNPISYIVLVAVVLLYLKRVFFPRK